MGRTIFRRTHSPNRLVWSESWRPPGAQFAYIKWTGWTSDDSTINIVVVIIIIIIIIPSALPVPSGVAKVGVTRYGNWLCHSVFSS